MIWLLIVYAMGMLFMTKMLENSLDYAYNTWAALMWPLIVIALFVEWMRKQ